MPCKAPDNGLLDQELHHFFILLLLLFFFLFFFFFFFLFFLSHISNNTHTCTHPLTHLPTYNHTYRHTHSSTLLLFYILPTSKLIVGCVPTSDSFDFMESVRPACGCLRKKEYKKKTSFFNWGVGTGGRGKVGFPDSSHSWLLYSAAHWETRLPAS